MTSAATTVGEVLERLEAIDRALPPGDGVRWFNRLYSEVTQQVVESMPGRHQAAPGFLEALDVGFANLYFDAFEAAADGAPPPGYPFHAWKPLFEARFETGVAPVQFALAGMNAHINHDLAIGICETCAARGTEPRCDGPEHEDFESVNALIAEVEKTMKAWMMTGLLRELDLVFNPVDDIVAVWNVERARDAAWVGAEVIWTLRSLPPLADDYTAADDRAVGFAGRALLAPVGLAS